MQRERERGGWGRWASVRVYRACMRDSERSYDREQNDAKTKTLVAASAREREM